MTTTSFRIHGTNYKVNATPTNKYSTLEISCKVEIHESFNLLFV